MESSRDLHTLLADAGEGAAGASRCRYRLMPRVLRRKPLRERPVQVACLRKLRAADAITADESFEVLQRRVSGAGVRREGHAMTAVWCPYCRRPMPTAEECIEAKVAALLERCRKDGILVPDADSIDEHDAATMLRLSWDWLRAKRYEGKSPPYRRASRRRIVYRLTDLAIFEINRESNEILY
jgi:hypothetical protein